MANEFTSLSNQISRPASFLPSPGPAIGLPSPLGSQMSGQKSQGKSKKDMSTPLLLTALVDAFSILVIFLLVQIQGAPAPFDQDAKLMLPTAASIENDKPAAANDLIANIIVRDSSYVLDGAVVGPKDLASALKNLKTQAVDRVVRLIIQADQESEFDMMSPLLASTAEAGISKLEFAVRAKL